jgi:hypothetical protein
MGESRDSIRNGDFDTEYLKKPEEGGIKSIPGSTITSIEKTFGSMKKVKMSIKAFGSKHIKILKFVATMMRCLRNCYEQKHKSLNIDLN